MSATRTSAVRIRLRTDVAAAGDAAGLPVLDATTRADLATMVGALAVVTKRPRSTPPAAPVPAPSPTASAQVAPPVAVAARPVADVTPVRRAPGGVLGPWPARPSCSSSWACAPAGGSRAEYPAPAGQVATSAPAVRPHTAHESS